MHNYQFWFDDLRHTLSDEQLNMSFSKAKHSDTAALYILDSHSQTWNAKRFEVTRDC
jgi:hypothetical protein